MTRKKRRREEREKRKRERENKNNKISIKGILKLIQVENDKNYTNEVKLSNEHGISLEFHFISFALPVYFTQLS